MKEYQNLLDWLLSLKNAMANGWPLPDLPSFWHVPVEFAEAVYCADESTLKDFAESGILDNPQAIDLGFGTEALKNKYWLK